MNQGIDYIQALKIPASKSIERILVVVAWTEHSSGVTTLQLTLHAMETTVNHLPSSGLPPHLDLTP